MTSTEGRRRGALAWPPGAEQGRGMTATRVARILGALRLVNSLVQVAALPVELAPGVA